MMDLTMNQLLSLWVQLEDAYNSRNTYEGDTAEVYAYTLQPYCPTAVAARIGSYPNNIHAEALAKQNDIAQENLETVVHEFCNRRQCEIQVEGNFHESHRVHMRVIRTQSNL